MTPESQRLQEPAAGGGSKAERSLWRRLRQAGAGDGERGGRQQVGPDLTPASPNRWWRIRTKVRRPPPPAVHDQRGGLATSRPRQPDGAGLPPPANTRSPVAVPGRHPWTRGDAAPCRSRLFLCRTPPYHRVGLFRSVWVPLQAYTPPQPQSQAYAAPSTAASHPMQHLSTAGLRAEGREPHRPTACPQRQAYEAPPPEPEPAAGPFGLQGIGQHMLRSTSSRRPSKTAQNGSDASMPALGQHLLKKTSPRNVEGSLRRVEAALPGYHPNGPVDFSDEAAVIARLDEIEGIVDAWMQHLGVE